MTADLLAIVTLAGGAIAVVTAIWQVAEIKEKIVQRVDRVDSKLSDRLAHEYDRLEDLVKEFEKRFDLQQAKGEGETRRRELEIGIELEQLQNKYRTAKKDLNDVQQFLQTHHGFKIRINTPTLEEDRRA